MPDAKIRTAEEADLHAIALLHNSIFSDLIQERGLYQYREVGPKEVQNWLSNEQVTQSQILVAEMDKLVGYVHCALTVEKGDSEVPVMWGVPHNWDFGQSKMGVLHRLRRQGIGRALVEQGLRFDWQQTPKYSAFLIYEDNIPARRMLEKLGYTPIDIYMDSDFSETRPLLASSILAYYDLERKIQIPYMVGHILLRPATSEDMESIVRINRSNVWWDERTWDQKWVSDFIAGKFNHSVFVGEYKGRVVGEFDFNNVTAEIGFAGVLPEFQGKGIGTVLLAELLRVMKMKGFTGAVASSGCSQKAAIRLYSKLGFETRKQMLYMREL